MSIFGTIFGSTKKYSTQEETLTNEEIKKMVSRLRIRTLDQKEEDLIEQAIAARRQGDGKISLQQIHEVLTKLKNQHSISDNDRRALMEVFTEYLEQK
ncbi:MAG TPA: hypothetical protein VJB37_01965 [Patescibacteria group bacterium]|nr:hypothetical protein [Patescibacteria group bacterium]